MDTLSKSCLVMLCLVTLTFVGPVTVEGQTGTSAPGILATRELGDDLAVEITEFRRKGNTLTLHMQFRNNGARANKIRLDYNKGVYLLDEPRRKLYKVLFGSGVGYIATGHPPDYSPYWQTEIPAGQSAFAWVKFPAPPKDVKELSLVLGSALPIEGLLIQGD